MAFFSCLICNGRGNSPFYWERTRVRSRGEISSNQEVEEICERCQEKGFAERWISAESDATEIEVDEFGEENESYDPKKHDALLEQIKKEARQ